MYSHEATKGFKVSGDNFPEISTSSSDYWVCNAASSAKQVSYTSSLTEANPNASCQKWSLQSSLSYPSTLPYSAEQQIPQFNQHITHGNLISSNNNEWNKNWTPQASSGTEGYSNSSTEKSSLVSHLSHPKSSSQLGQQQIPLFDTISGNSSLLNNNESIGTQFYEESLQTHNYSNGDLFDFNHAITSSNIGYQHTSIPHEFQHTSNENLSSADNNVNTFNNGVQILQAPQEIHLNANNETLLLESNLNYLNPSSKAEQFQIPQFNLHSTNGNIIPPNNNQCNKTWVPQAPLQAESYPNCNNQKVLPESNLNYQQLQIPQSNLNADNGNTIVKNNNELYGTKVSQQLPQRQPYPNSGYEESSSVLYFNHANPVSHIGQQQILPCYERKFNENYISPNNNVPTGTQVNQVPVQPPQYSRSSYQSNTPSIISAVTQMQLNSCISRSYQINQSTNKPHMASFVKTAGGAIRTNVKTKRKRTMFTTEQVTILENVFSKKPYVSREDRLALEKQLHINEKTIKVWFQNRRLKDKRLVAELYQEIYSPDSSIGDTPQETSSFTGFDNYSCKESLITNQNGFLSLDGHSIKQNSIPANNCINNENILQKAMQLSDLKSIQEDTKWSTMYEPISPAATDSSHNTEPFMTQDLLEPEESLQQLIDLQSILNPDYSS